MSADPAWVNRIEIKSETSDRVYVVSQHAEKRFWACSCPGWKSHRKCKHLTNLGLPNHEQPFEVKKEHAKEKGFLDGYATYDTSAGHGTAEEWQKTFTARMGLAEARKALGLPKSAGWDDVRRAFRLAGTEAVQKLVDEYEAAAGRFGDGDLEVGAAVVKEARFRLEAYAAYLAEQKAKLEAEGDRITRLLLGRMEVLTTGGP
jgi:hypothetical protein